MKGKKRDEESHTVTWLHDVKPDHLLRVLCGQIQEDKKDSLFEKFITADKNWWSIFFFNFNQNKKFLWYQFWIKK